MLKKGDARRRAGGPQSQRGLMASFDTGHLVGLSIIYHIFRDMQKDRFARFDALITPERFVPCARPFVPLRMIDPLMREFSPARGCTHSSTDLKQFQADRRTLGIVVPCSSGPTKIPLRLAG
jgi:hypothetical protein